MQRKYILFTILVIATMLISACASTTATPVATEAPVVTEAPGVVPTEAPVVKPTEAPPAERSVVTLTWIQEPDNFNPHYTNMWFTTTMAQIWNAWAWEFDDKSQPYPKLVTEIPSLENGGISEDGKTITMTLRSDVVWSDGITLTSTDFKFTQEMAVEPANTVASTYPYDMIDSVDTPDDQTVVIHFANPFAPWLALLWHGILPAHILQPVFDADGTLDNAEWNMAPTVGIGPYIFNKWESGSYVNFVKNDKYWGTPAKIDEIFFRIVPDEAAQVQSLQAGDADIGYWYEWSDVQKLKDAGFTIMVVPNGYDEGIFLLVNNVESSYNGVRMGHPAMLDVKVRQAIAMAIDRESLNQNLNLGNTTVPASFWDSIPLYSDVAIKDYVYDLDRAKALLDEAGWIDSNNDGTRDKEGVELILRYGTTNMEKRQKAQVVIKEDLAAVGIGIEISSLDSTLFFGTYGEGGPASTGQLELQEWSDAPMYPDPDIYYWLCSEIPSDEYPDGSNSFFLCDEELDALIQLQATQLDYNARHETIAKINKIFQEKVYWLGLWQDPDPWAIGPRLQNVKFSPVNPFFNIYEWTIAP